MSVPSPGPCVSACLKQGIEECTDGQAESDQRDDGCDAVSAANGSIFIVSVEAVIERVDQRTEQGDRMWNPLPQACRIADYPVENERRKQYDHVFGQ